jgi:hypothetical protein
MLLHHSQKYLYIKSIVSIGLFLLHLPTIAFLALIIFSLDVS